VSTSPATPTTSRARPAIAWIAAIAVVMAFAFLGSRGIWDPDEGRYTNVALNMLDSGDWLNPQRTDDTGHWTKPPLTYWLIAASVAAFGQNPWAARLPIALSYLACVYLVWRLGRRLLPGSESTAATIYATLLLPLGAAQLITTDFPLTALQTLAVTAFVEARFGQGRAYGWLALMWLAFALAFLTKGPPGLLPLLAIVVYQFLLPQPGGRRVLSISGLVIFVVVALPWFVAVTTRHAGLLDYFVGAEIAGRIASPDFGRHPEWYGWLQIYAPTLVLGSLPWTGTLWRWVRTLPADLRRWRDPAVRREQAPLLLLTVWVLVPLLVFCIARSRLPLYLLPLFGPLALLAARQRHRDGAARPLGAWLAGWVLLALVLKAAAAYWPTHKDASVWAAAIRERAPVPVTEIVFVEDMARYGIHLHLDAEVEKISLQPIDGPRFNPEYDEDLATELRESEGEPGAIWIAKSERLAQIRAAIDANGHVLEPLGTPFRGRTLFTVHRKGAAPAAAPGADPAAADRDGRQ